MGLLFPVLWMGDAGEGNGEGGGWDWEDGKGVEERGGERYLKNNIYIFINIAHIHIHLKMSYTYYIYTNYIYIYPYSNPTLGTQIYPGECCYIYRKLFVIL